MKAMKRLNKEGMEKERKKRKKQKKKETKKMNKAFIIHASALFFSPHQDCGICVFFALVFFLCLSLSAIHTDPVSCCNSKAALNF